jgi:hypothetical protein
VQGKVQGGVQGGMQGGKQGCVQEGVQGGVQSGVHRGRPHPIASLSAKTSNVPAYCGCGHLPALTFASFLPLPPAYLCLLPTAPASSSVPQGSGHVATHTLHAQRFHYLELESLDFTALASCSLAAFRPQ